MYTSYHVERPVSKGALTKGKLIGINMVNAKAQILKNVNVSFVHFCLGKHNFSFHTFKAHIIYISWLTVVQDNLKAPFSIATTSRCRGGHYSFLWIAPLTLDAYLIMLSVKQGGIKYYFLSLRYDSTWDWTLISQSFGEHSNQYVSGLVIYAWSSFNE